MFALCFLLPVHAANFFFFLSRPVYTSPPLPHLSFFANLNSCTVALQKVLRAALLWQDSGWVLFKNRSKADIHCDVIVEVAVPVLKPVPLIWKDGVKSIASVFLIHYCKKRKIAWHQQCVTELLLNSCSPALNLVFLFLYLVLFCVVISRSKDVSFHISVQLRKGWCSWPFVFLHRSAHEKKFLHHLCCSILSPWKRKCANKTDHFRFFITPDL